MKNYTITEEQIKELAKGNKKVEKMFPEAFKPQLEVGKWYKINNEDGYLLNYQKGEANSYGFMDGEYRTDWFFDEYHISSSIEATKEEVKSALIKEAERRGFKYDIEFKEIEDRRNGSAFFTKTGKVGSGFYFSDNSLYSIGYGRWCIFKDGVWAEIIKEAVTLNYQQIADKFGVVVEQLRITKN